MNELIIKIEYNNMHGERIKIRSGCCLLSSYSYNWTGVEPGDSGEYEVTFLYLSIKELTVFGNVRIK